jgi:hypothetical protein
MNTAAQEAIPNLAVSTNGMDHADKTLWTAAFLKLLPTAISASGWKIEGTLVTSGEGKVKLAGLWADYAVTEQRNRFG